MNVTAWLRTEPVALLTGVTAAGVDCAASFTPLNAWQQATILALANAILAAVVRTQVSPTGKASPVTNPAPPTGPPPTAGPVTEDTPAPVETPGPIIATHYLTDEEAALAPIGEHRNAPVPLPSEAVPVPTEAAPTVADRLTENQPAPVEEAAPQPANDLPPADDAAPTVGDVPAVPMVGSEDEPDAT